MNLIFFFITLQLTVSSNIIKFYPGCYPNDNVSHEISLDVVVDYGLYKSLTKNTVGNKNIKHNITKNIINKEFSYGRSFFLKQLNVVLRINKYIIGKKTDPVPLSRGSGYNKCNNAFKGFDEINSWVYKYNNDSSAITILLTKCYRGITGKSYIGSICKNSGNVSYFNHGVIFHELGHAIGAQHSFQEGIGSTGGIMDYGNGLYNKTLQFHPYNKQQICNFLSFIYNDCKFFKKIV